MEIIISANEMILKLIQSKEYGLTKDMTRKECEELLEKFIKERKEDEEI